MKVKSKFFLPTILMTSAFAMSFIQYKSDERYIDLGAFKNLASNVSEIATNTNVVMVAENNVVNANIIKTIENELTRKPLLHRLKSKVKLTKRSYNLPTVHVAEKIEEINNKDLIELYEIKTEKKSFKKFDTVIIDEVKVVAAATVQVPVLEIENESQNESGPIEPVDPVVIDEVKESDNIDANIADADMPMFDYSEVKLEKKSSSPYERALSTTVKEAISREVGANPVKLVEKQKIKAENNEQIAYDYSQTTPQPIPTQKDKKVEGFTATQSSAYQLTAYRFDISKEKNFQINSFNFTPDYNREERVDSALNGIAQINWGLVEGVNTQTGTVEADEMMPTRVELNLSTHNKMRIPMIAQEEAERLYPGKNLLLLAVDSIVVETEIDSSYSEKLFLSEHLKKVENPADARFVLYTGIKNGNILLKYYLSNKETAQKVIYVGENEMYFEEANFIDSERDLYSFSTRNLMSSKSTDLSISPDLINVFNTNITARKRTLNSYELKMPTLVSGSRKYIEMKHLSDSIFIGTDTKFEIDVPSNDFIAKVLEVNQVSSLKDHCVVQINISKDLEGLTVNGKNHRGEMYTETSFLGEDGNFSKTDFEQAEKVFVIGDMEGIFNAKLEYSDGSTQFLKTYCSEGTYIVEQL